MLVLFPVPYIPGDKQDEDHVRVANHHSVGLSGRHVNIWGSQDTRFVRFVSAPDGFKHAQSYLVHLKPIAVQSTRLRCRDLSTIYILRRVERQSRFPTQTELLIDNNLSGLPDWLLIKRKRARLLTKGYVVSKNKGFELTAKGKQLLATN